MILRLMATAGIVLLAPSVGTAQDMVRAGELGVRLKTLTAWNPYLDPASDMLELTPTDVAPLSDGTGRLLVATLGGTIRVYDPARGLLDLPLLTHAQTGLQLQLESGTTSLVLHPNFAGDADAFGFGKAYTITTENDAGRGGLATEMVDFPFANEVHQDVVREWDLSPIVGNVDVHSIPSLDVSQSREILRVAQPGPFHNLFDMAFDRSLDRNHVDYGQLYITSGDGGDSEGNASTTVSRKQAGQDLASVYGTVLRINPDPLAHELVRESRSSKMPAYSISPNNPFHGDEEVESRTDSNTLAEVFAYGLRSPFRINIDAWDGLILVSDVGERQREEISLIEIGGNYGWGRFEGTRQDNAIVELGGPSAHSPPIFEYGREVGWSAIGGTVYRGIEFPQLFGKYVFADFGQAGASARLFYGSVDPKDDDFGEIFEFDLSLSQERFPVSTDKDAIPDTQAKLPDRIFSIGEDANGELLLVAGQDPRGPVDSVPGAFLIRLTRGLGCDLTGDGTCQLDDINLLIDARTQNARDNLFDVNFDAVVDSMDIDDWLQQVGHQNAVDYRPGDTNLDGRVDFEDFGALSGNFGVTGTNWSQGNFDGRDGTNFDDFVTMVSHFGHVSTAGVPEPSGWALASAGILLMLLRAGRSGSGAANRFCMK